MYLTKTQGHSDLKVEVNIVERKEKTLSKIWKCIEIDTFFEFHPKFVVLLKSKRGKISV